METAARAVTRHPLVTASLGGLMGVAVGLVAGWAAYTHWNVMPRGAPPPLLAFTLAGGAGTGIAAVLLSNFVPRSPMTICAAMAIAMDLSAVLLPVPTSLLLGYSLLGSSWEMHGLWMVAASSFAAAFAGPAALAAAAMWTGATHWLATGSVRPMLDRKPREADLLRAVLILASAIAVVGACALYFVLDWIFGPRIWMD